MRKHRMLLGGLLLSFVSALASGQAPVPFIQLPLIPDAAAPGGPRFVLTVNGTGFVSESVVYWNGAALTTKFISGSELTAVVPATNIATVRTGGITVVNPAPGGGTSNPAFFSVNAAKSAGFTLVSSWSVGRSPSSLAVGDFNRDGKLDLVTTNADNTVSILLGDGAGKFSPATSVAVGSQPVSVALGDFNGDGNPDLAVVNQGDKTVSILLGDGAGNFSMASSMGVGGSSYDSWAVVVGDFNGDGKLDLAVASDQIVSILLGDGTGYFSLASALAADCCSNALAVGDFNADGKLDLGISDSGEKVSIWLGDGTGNFTLDSTEYSGYVPDSLVAGDFNSDGALDLAAANNCGEILGDDCNPGTVTLVLGAGMDYQIYLHSYYPTSMAAGDFNGDNTLDLAVANDCGYDRTCASGGTVSILLGDGKSNFTLPSSPAAGSWPKALAVGDFNQDGKLDLVVANGTDPGTVSLLLWDPRAVTLSPVNLTFATQRIGTSSPSQTLTLTNIGNQKLAITRITASANFSQTNNCGSGVKAGASCTITVAFKPNGTGTLTGAITITDNAANGAQTVALTGVGTAVSLVPTGLAFGSYTVGTTSPPQTVTLTNYGSTALSVQAIHFTETNLTDFAQTNNCGTSVKAGGSCAINVTFTPGSIGKKTAKLIVADDGGASPQKVSVTGTGK